MNNKGFAITGILYTLFALFSMTLLTILGTTSYKKATLSKTIEGLENDFNLVSILKDGNNDGTIDNSEEIYDHNRQVLISGKYEFTLTTPLSTEKIICTAYLKKGTKIPEQKISVQELEDGNDEFPLIPYLCNQYTYNIYLLNNNEEDGLKLTNVYKFEG